MQKNWGSNTIDEDDDDGADSGGVESIDAALAVLGGGAVGALATGGTFSVAFAGADLAAAGAGAGATLADAFAFEGGGAKAFPTAGLESFGAID